jgi:hypothetical protein
MARRIEDIEARVAMLDKLRAAELAREHRLLDATAEFYAKQEEAEVAGLGPLMEKVDPKSADLRGFFRAQQAVAVQRIEEVTPLLQLSEEEIAHFESIRRAIVLIDPCGLVPAHSPGWKCAWTATSCDFSPWTTADASATCTCAPAVGQNRCDPRVEALGQGERGWRSAVVDCWCYFDIPARPGPANVDIDVRMNLHGFYVVRSATGSASFRLEVKAEGFQYGFSWGSDSATVLDLSGDTMGRYDSVKKLGFLMPVGADPFVVRVSAKLTVTAKSGGALAVGDFGTGAGNYLETVYVNTLD